MLPEQRFYTSVGQRIREIRLEKGLSQGEIARRIGSYQQNIARAEAGTNLTLDVLYRLAVALDVEPAAFFSFPNQKSASRSPPRRTPRS